jgi:hypothetical protein
MTPDTIPPGCPRCKKLIKGLTASNRIAARLQDRLTESEAINRNLNEKIKFMKANRKEESP